MSRRRFGWRSTRFTTWPVRPRRVTINTIPLRRSKRPSSYAINVLGMAKRCRAKVLQASTSEVYGDPEVHPQPETYRGAVNPIGPRACYDEGKRVAETLFMDYHRMNRVNIRIVRIFNNYGTRMHPYDGRVVSNFTITAKRLGTRYHDLRRWLAKPRVLLSRRSCRGPDPDDECAGRLHWPDQFGQSGRVHDS